MAGALAVGLGVLATGLVAWSGAEEDPSRAFAATRDEVLVTAQEEVAVLNTLDHRDIDGGLAAWGEVTTGVLHDQVTTLAPEDRAALESAGKVSTGTVLTAGLTDLDLRAGTATGIFLVEISVQGTTGQAETKRNRFVGDLVDDDGSWKLTRLEPVAVSGR